MQYKKVVYQSVNFIFKLKILVKIKIQTKKKSREVNYIQFEKERKKRTHFFLDNPRRQAMEVKTNTAEEKKYVSFYRIISLRY